MLRVGIVGAGFMGALHAQAWRATPATLTGVYSLYPDMVRAVIDRYGGRAYPGLDALVADVDVVDICAPTHVHHEIALQAAAAGKHVVCEKPLARTIAQAEEMIAACEQAGVKLLVGHVVRYFPQYAQAKALVERGEVGDVAVVRLTRASAPPTRAHDNWFMETDKSGGMILDLMLHDLDYARWVAGEVDSVFAKSARSARHDAPGDYALAILRHASGAISNLEGAWAYPPPLFRTSLQIAGSQGLIDHPADSTGALHLTVTEDVAGTAAALGVSSSPLTESPYTTQIKEFYEALAHDAPTRVTARDGLMALRLAFAAIQSADTGRPVSPLEVA